MPIVIPAEAGIQSARQGSPPRRQRPPFALSLSKGERRQPGHAEKET